MTQAFNSLRNLVRPALTTMVDGGADETRLILAVTALLARDAGPSLATIPHGDPQILPRIAHVLFGLLAIEALVVPNDQIEKGLCWQYPDQCRACEHKPCRCGLARPQARDETTDIVMLPASATPKTLAAWQIFLTHIYPNNEHMRTGEIILRLASEAHEACAVALDRALMRHKSEVVVELAQVFAWLCAFATRREISFDSDLRSSRRDFALWMSDLRTLIA